MTKTETYTNWQFFLDTSKALGLVAFSILDLIVWIYAIGKFTGKF